MRMEPVNHYRHAVGNFHRSLDGRQPAQDHARWQRFGASPRPLTIHNLTQLALFLNLLAPRGVAAPHQERSGSSLPGDTAVVVQRIANLPPLCPSSLLGGASAVALPGANWMDHLADLLGTRISQVEARLELDIQAIADTTRAGQHGPGSIAVRREAINQARMDTIARLFEDEGHTVERLPYRLSVRSLYGFPYRPSGRNLRITLSGGGERQRTLMLVAHGDVTAGETGTTGSLDNGAAVAALLALARRLDEDGLPEGTRVEFLLPHQQKPEMHGAKGYVTQCKAAGNCPDLMLDLDQLGRGDGLTLSGSDRHVLLRDGDSRPYGTDTTAVTPAECDMAQHLRTAAAASGLPVHDTEGFTQPSDHIIFQRAGIPGLGISLMDRRDIPLERDRQRAHLEYVLSEAEVDWSRYEAWLDGQLNATDAAWFDRKMARADAAADAFQKLPLSAREQRVGSPADQPGQVDPAQTLVAVGVLHNAIIEWLGAPGVGEV